MSSDPALSTLIEVLIAELHLAGALDGANISNMARRLREAGFEDQAAGVMFLPFVNAMDSPEERRATLSLVPDGGNEAD
ncbi:MAG: hypothetical protein V4696_06230 [Pseudomonadota bacterium]